MTWAPLISPLREPVAPVLAFLLRSGATDATPVTAKRPDDEQELQERPRPLYCKQCGLEVATEDDLIAMDGESPRRVFPNPFGALREIYTLGETRGLDIQGPATTEFTWFKGYAWEVAYCGSCRAHLGWRFVSVESSRDPDTFYGLLVEAITTAENA